MKTPRVLIAAPTSINKRYCDAEFISHSKAMSYENKHIYLVDNSPTKQYSIELRKQGIEVDWINPKGRPLRETMAICNNKIRDKALSEGFDYLFSLETDQFPPSNILEVLLSHNKPVISLPYFWGHGSERFLLLRSIDGDNKGYYEKSLDLMEGFLFIDGKVNQVFSCGLGCMLINKDTLEGMKFRVDNKQNTDCHADSFFSQDLFYNKIDNIVDTSAISWHYNSDWGAVVDNF